MINTKMIINNLLIVMIVKLTNWSIRGIDWSLYVGDFSNNVVNYVIGTISLWEHNMVELEKKDRRKIEILWCNSVISVVRSE